jgi:hypothetical protein
VHHACPTRVRSSSSRKVQSIATTRAFALQLYYVLDALWNEAAILTTMDITTDGFGFMLAFGDLCWVPFVFTTATRYLADWPQVMGGRSSSAAEHVVQWYVAEKIWSSGNPQGFGCCLQRLRYPNG